MKKMGRQRKSNHHLQRLMVSHKQSNVAHHQACLLYISFKLLLPKGQIGTRWSKWVETFRGCSRLEFTEKVSHGPCTPVTLDKPWCTLCIFWFLPLLEHVFLDPVHQWCLLLTFRSHRKSHIFSCNSVWPFQWLFCQTWWWRLFPLPCSL